MTRYNLYDDGQYHGGVKLIAIGAGSEIDQQLANDPQVEFVATVDADTTTEFDPASSTFQSRQTSDYITTGLEWPNNKAVVVR